MTLQIVKRKPISFGVSSGDLRVSRQRAAAGIERLTAEIIHG